MGQRLQHSKTGLVTCEVDRLMKLRGLTGLHNEIIVLTKTLMQFQILLKNLNSVSPAILKVQTVIGTMMVKNYSE